MIIDYELNGMSMPAGERIYRWACRVVELNPNSKLGGRTKKSDEEWREGAVREGITPRELGVRVSSAEDENGV